jgi:hypothetical protein
MRLTGTHRHGRSGCIHSDASGFAAVEASASDAFAAFDMRREPEAFGVRAPAADPYASWLAEREAEKETSRPEIRWVYRHDRVTRPATTLEEIGS